MNEYRITKYNPANRNTEGFYTKHDWTSVSDIGQTFDGVILTHVAYGETEDAYVRAVALLLKENGISQMTVRALEKNECAEEYLQSAAEKELYQSITDNALLDVNRTETAVRLALREVIWCILSAGEKDMEIHFGYDYYMYVKCREISASAKQTIADSGLFIEPLSESKDSAS